MVAGQMAIHDKREALGDFSRRRRRAREGALANPDAQARIWAEQTGFSVEVGKVVVDTAQTCTVAIDDGVVAAKQRVADFFQAAHVMPEAQKAGAFFDLSFNAAVFAA